MRIVAWMVVKDDQFYVDMALKSVLPFVDGVYIQDQASTDGTIEEIKKIGSDKIRLEIVDTNLPRFDPKYDEPFYRSLALARAELWFNPDFLLKLDADEIYTPYFFEQIKAHEAEFKAGTYAAARISGDRFISTTRKVATTKTQHGLVIHEGQKYYDPHTHFWRANLKVRYVKNPAMTGFTHCVLSPDPHPQLWIPGVCDVHLHRTFGPKSITFWEEGGEKINREKPCPPVDCPNWYKSDVNLGESEECDFPWPEYVLEKWRAWGIW